MQPIQVKILCKKTGITTEKRVDTGFLNRNNPENSGNPTLDRSRGHPGDIA
jgi:hypothetical protein